MNKEVILTARFVVHKHYASHLHYDFRLELDGVLKSWAVPKKLPLEPAEKHLAVEVDDHPLAYIDFEGEIPEGDYGAGRVEIWDRGFFELLERDKKKIIINLFGQKLKGRLNMIKTGGSNWLAIKSRDS